MRTTSQNGELHPCLRLNLLKDHFPKTLSPSLLQPGTPPVAAQNHHLLFSHRFPFNTCRTQTTIIAMSLHERAVINLVSQLALSCDGAVLGVVLACAAVRTVIKFAYTSSALRKLRNAPYVKVSDLRAILAPDDSQPSDAKLVVLRGTVEAKSAVDGKSNSLKSSVFASQGTRNSAVVVQRTQTVIFDFFRCSVNLIFVFVWRKLNWKFQFL